MHATPAIVFLCSVHVLVCIVCIYVCICVVTCMCALYLCVHCSCICVVRCVHMCVCMCGYVWLSYVSYKSQGAEINYIRLIMISQPTTDMPIKVHNSNEGHFPPTLFPHRE